MKKGVEMETFNFKESKCKNCIYSAICSSLTNDAVRENCTDFIAGEHIGFVSILDVNIKTRKDENLIISR